MKPRAETADSHYPLNTMIPALLLCLQAKELIQDPYETAVINSVSGLRGLLGR